MRNARVSVPGVSALEGFVLAALCGVQSTTSARWPWRATIVVGLEGERYPATTDNRSRKISDFGRALFSRRRTPIFVSVVFATGVADGILRTNDPSHRVSTAMFEVRSVELGQI